MKIKSILLSLTMACVAVAQQFPQTELPVNTPSPAVAVPYAQWLLDNGTNNDLWLSMLSLSPANDVAFHSVFVRQTDAGHQAGFGTGGLLFGGFGGYLAGTYYQANLVTPLFHADTGVWDGNAASATLATTATTANNVVNGINIIGGNISGAFNGSGASLSNLYVGYQQLVVVPSTNYTSGFTNNSKTFGPWLGADYVQQAVNSLFSPTNMTLTAGGSIKVIGDNYMPYPLLISNSPSAGVRTVNIFSESYRAGALICLTNPCIRVSGGVFVPGNGNMRNNSMFELHDTTIASIPNQTTNLFEMINGVDTFNIHDNHWGCWYNITNDSIGPGYTWPAGTSGGNLVIYIRGFFNNICKFTGNNVIQMTGAEIDVDHLYVAQNFFNACGYNGVQQAKINDWPDGSIYKCQAALIVGNGTNNSFNGDVIAIHNYFYNCGGGYCLLGRASFSSYADQLEAMGGQPYMIVTNHASLNAFPPQISNARNFDGLMYFLNPDYTVGSPTFAPSVMQSGRMGSENTSVNANSWIVRSNITAQTFTGIGSSLTQLNGSQVTSGTIDDARLSVNVPLLNAVNTFTKTNTAPGLKISNELDVLTLVVTGAVSAGSLTVSGSAALTTASSLPAANLTGSIADARLSANVPLLNIANNFSAALSQLGFKVITNAYYTNLAGITFDGLGNLAVGTNTFFSGGGSVNITNVTADILISSNLVVGTFYTNNYGTMITIQHLTAVPTVALVAGNVSASLEISGVSTNPIWSAPTAIGVGIAGAETNSLPTFTVPTNAIFRIVDTSAGAGNSVALAPGAQILQRGALTVISAPNSTMSLSSLTLSNAISFRGTAPTCANLNTFLSTSTTLDGSASDAAMTLTVVTTGNTQVVTTNYATITLAGTPTSTNALHVLFTEFNQTNLLSSAFVRFSVTGVSSNSFNISSIGSAPVASTTYQMTMFVTR